ncbi:NUDIX domain-containing protein [Streptomyces sp. SBR177]
MTMTDEEYGALRASAALWAGTSVLITNRCGDVLVQHVDYLETCLLPGGGVDAGESPARAAARELREELGVTAVVERGLAVDWVSAASVAAPAAMRFPGSCCTSSTAAPGTRSGSARSGCPGRRSRTSSSSNRPGCRS